MSATPSGQIVEVPLPLEALLSQLNTVNLVMLYIFREYLAKICSNLPRHATSAPVSNLLGFGEFLSDNIFYARLLVLLKVEITVTKEELASFVLQSCITLRSVAAASAGEDFLLHLLLNGM